MVKTQNQASRRCIGSAAKGKTDRFGNPGQTLTAAACLTNDPTGKYAKLVTKLEGKDVSLCLGAAEQLPDYGYVGAEAVSIAARDAGVGLVEDIFGVDLDAAILLQSGDDRDGSRCQGDIVKRANKFLNDLWKTAVKAKLNSLKCSSEKPPGACVGAGLLPVASSIELQGGIDDQLDLDATGKIGKASASLLGSAVDRCTPATTPLALLFPGVCADAVTPADLAACIEAAVRRRFCESLNAFDGFLLDCDGTPPEVISVSPTDAATGVAIAATVTVRFDEDIDPTSIGAAAFTLTGGATGLDGSFTPDGSDGFIFTPDAPLALATVHTVHLPIDGILDLSGSDLDAEFVSTFETIGPPPALTAIVPDQGKLGETVVAEIQGSSLDGIVSITIDGTDITLNDLGTGDASTHDVEIVIGGGASLGEHTITVTTATGNDTVPFTVKPDIVTLTPLAINMDTRDTGMLTVSLPAAAPSGGFSVDLASNATGIATVPASVTILQGSASVDFDVTSLVTDGQATISASAPGVTGDDALANVALRGFSVVIPPVGIGYPITATVTLDAVAPTGGVTLDFSVDNTGVATVDTASVTIPAGSIQTTFGMNGVSEAATILNVDGAADGYETQAIDIEAFNNQVILPASQNLAMGVVVTFPVRLSPNPAPVGGLVVDVTSDVPSVVEVLTPTVTVLEGEVLADAQIRAVAETGTANITGSRPALRRTPCWP